MSKGKTCCRKPAAIANYCGWMMMVIMMMVLPLILFRQVYGIVMI